MRRTGSVSFRVLHLVHDLDIGGAQVAVCNLATALADLACEPAVHAWKHGGPLVARLRENGCRVDAPARVPRGWRRVTVPVNLVQRVRREAVDLVHAHMSDAAVWGVLVQMLTGRPCVITHHSNDLTDTTVPAGSWQSAARRRVLGWSVRAAAANIAVSGAVRDRLVSELGVSPARIEVLPNCVPLPPAERVRAAAARRRARAGGGAPEWPRVVYVGRLAATKGLDTLLAAWPGVVRTFPAATLCLVGDGPVAGALRAQAARTGMTSRVTFAGATLSPDAWFADADLFVSASTVEGLSIALLEAMAWEVPVVVSDIPGHREVVRAEATGRLVPVAAPAAFAEAIVAALHDPETSAACAARARQLVCREHDLAAAVRSQVAMYRRLLQHRPGR